MLKYAKSIMIILAFGFLCGCASSELEQRSFPLAMGIDLQTEKGESRLAVSYDFPDLNQISEKTKTSDTPMQLSLEGADLYHIEKSYENNTNRILDYNHLKNIILGKENLENPGTLREILENWEEQQKIARNTSLFLADGKASEILLLTQETEGSVGKYLEEMLDSQKDFKTDKIASAGDFLNQWHNQNELLLIPVLTEQGERPAITRYGMISDFQYVGDISVEEAMQSFLSQNMLEQFLCECSDKTVVEITDIQAKKSITESGGLPVVTVSVKGNGRIRQMGNQSAGRQYQIEQQIEEQLEFDLAKTAKRIQEEFGADMTNSYIGLGGHSRKLYEKYKNMPQTYGKEVRQVFQAEIKILDW